MNHYDKVCPFFLFFISIHLLHKARYLLVRKLVKCLTRAEREDLRLSVVLMQVIGPKVASTSYCGVPVSPLNVVVVVRIFFYLFNFQIFTLFVFVSYLHGEMPNYKRIKVVKASN